MITYSSNTQPRAYYLVDWWQTAGREVVAGRVLNKLIASGVLPNIMVGRLKSCTKKKRY